ncbi:unnamed protein product [Protopolystoma xenopodis]|uniref:Uncharacterized protein n=1 Tax=Protopolystoma xenopodis TaxID=117903 RepID=A0A3S5CRW7_9PLAT|nr:unnamed protein product [Protopolystoma xenopodis]
MPLDTLLSFLLVCIGVIGIAGKFQEIEATAELRDKTWDIIGNRPSFYTFQHRSLNVHNFKIHIYIFMARQSVSNLSDGHSDSVAALSLSNRYLASGGDDGLVCLWSPDQSSAPISSISISEPCCAVKFGVDKPDLLYSAHNRNLYSWDIRNFSTPLAEWMVNDDEINCIDVLDCESRVAVADDTGAVKIIAMDTGNVVRSLKKHDNICSSVKFRPNKSWQIITGGLDCRLIVSDWKGTGLAVMIFEMDELIDANLYHDMTATLNEQVSLQHHPSDVSHTDSEGQDSESDDIESLEELDTIGLHERNQAFSIAVTTPEEGFTVNTSNMSQDSPDNISQVTATRYTNPYGSSQHDDSIQRTDNAHSTSETEVSPRGFRVASNVDSNQSERPVANAWSVGVPVNPPMIHAIATTSSGSLVAAGLESSTIELFTGESKRLAHSESLYGHTRGVSALLCIQVSLLVIFIDVLNYYHVCLKFASTCILFRTPYT